jgi:hypothetical protein
MRVPNLGCKNPKAVILSSAGTGICFKPIQVKLNMFLPCTLRLLDAKMMIHQTLQQIQDTTGNHVNKLVHVKLD